MDNKNQLPDCGGLAWLDARCPPKPLYHSPSSAGQERKNTVKGSWVKIRTRRSLTSYHHGQNIVDLGKLV